MRFLVDACVASSVVRALRHAGFDVEWVTEWKRDPGDLVVLQRACEAGQVLVTRDKDFGALIFRDNRPHKGVLRIAGEMTFIEQAQRVLRTLALHADDLDHGCLVTVDTDRVRVTRKTTEH
jgi:predicted nuclease of predicted toxin-antitoxin system